MANINLPRLTTHDVVYRSDGTRKVIESAHPTFVLEPGDILFDDTTHTTMIINGDGRSASVIGDGGQTKQTETSSDDVNSKDSSSLNAFFKRLFGQATQAQQQAMTRQASATQGSGPDADSGILPNGSSTLYDSGDIRDPSSDTTHEACTDPNCAECLAQEHGRRGSPGPSGSPTNTGNPAAGNSDHSGGPASTHSHPGDSGSASGSMDMGTTNGHQIAALNHGESSHHNGSTYGELLDTEEQTTIAGKIFGGNGTGFVNNMRNWTVENHFFNQGQNAEEREAGTYMATNMASKFAVMNPNNFADEATASRVYGQAKSLAVKGDAAGLGKLVDQYGDRHGLSDDELVQLFNVNEHEYLHHISGGAPEGSLGRDLFNSCHAFSLSTSDMNANDGISAVQGGYNDKGEYPQWGWFEASKRIANAFGVSGNGGKSYADGDSAASGSDGQSAGGAGSGDSTQSTADGGSGGSSMDGMSGMDGADASSSGSADTSYAEAAQVLSEDPAFMNNGQYRIYTRAELQAMADDPATNPKTKAALEFLLSNSDAYNSIETANDSKLQSASARDDDIISTNDITTFLAGGGMSAGSSNGAESDVSSYSAPAQALLDDPLFMNNGQYRTYTRAQLEELLNDPNLSASARAALEFLLSNSDAYNSIETANDDMLESESAKDDDIISTYDLTTFVANGGTGGSGAGGGTSSSAGSGGSAGTSTNPVADTALPATSSGTLNLSANPALQPYAAAIAAASKATGIPPEIIGAQIWAESRGRVSTSTTNGDGSQDIGLMQISQGRLAKDNLSQDQKDAIKKATGKEWSALDVSNPADNIMAGAFHLKYFIGQNGDDVNAGLAAYVGRDPKYVANIQTFRSQLERNVPLSNDAGTPF